MDSSSVYHMGKGAVVAEVPGTMSKNSAALKYKPNTLLEVTVFFNFLVGISALEKVRGVTFIKKPSLF